MIQKCRECEEHGTQIENLVPRALESSTASVVKALAKALEDEEQSGRLFTRRELSVISLKYGKGKLNPAVLDNLIELIFDDRYG